MKSLSSSKPKKPPTPFTPQLQARFLDLYKTSNSVEFAASQCGISRSNIYERAKKDPDFTDLLDLARQHVIGKFERIAAMSSASVARV